MSNIRMPKQKRSIEKRNRIIEKGFELICKNGYYNTNTNDIAKYANVSTGIVYQYFNDKKEIFLEGINLYYNSIMFPILDVLDFNKDLDDTINEIIDKYILKHTLSKDAHEEIIALSHLDTDVSKIFHQKELDMTERVINLLDNSNIVLNNKKEKVHIIIGLIENLCHNIIYHNDGCFDYDKMKKEVINAIKYIIKG
ncbi:transcriptional regulator TetR family [Firmicutes bacterium CAG:884]|nr:TetR/AcrR family transcriptional regulator [Bacillota bacterium]CCY93824.1 transcriptional regulator TetR family [Firmicutes bacterium CAG:884]